MANLDLIMQTLALLALVMYLLPRLVGGRLGVLLPRLAAATLAAAFILALVQSWFWFIK